jgi:YVTN family beta-propeller protein
MRLALLLAALVPVVSPVFAADFQPPGGIRPAARRPGAETVLPGGRLVAPLGRQFSTGPGSFGLAVSPDGRFAVTANGGPNRYSLSVLDMSAEPWQIRQLATKPRDEKAASEEDDWRSVFMGLAFSDDRQLYASEGNSGRVREISLPSGSTTRLLQLNQGEWRDSYSGDLAFDSARRLLYVVDQANFRVAVFDARSRKLLASVRTGILPFKLALSPDARRLYVTNIGMFAYQPIPGADPKDAARTGLPFPAFGFPSDDALKGAKRQTAAGEVDVPPLGDPNSEFSNSLCVIDVTDPSRPSVVRFVRTGEPFGPRSLGGSSPSGVTALSGLIYVSNGNQDTISVIDAVTLNVRATIPLRIPGLDKYRGILPIGLSLDIPNNRLLVAEAGINAVGIVDLGSHKLVAHLPAGWFPTAVLADRGRMLVASAKGLGTGPNATRTAPLERSFQAELRSGVLSVYPTPLNRLLSIHTERVMAHNGFLPAADQPRPLPIELRHVVIIVKENRTYDEVFGDVDSDSTGSLRGAPELARFGRRGWVQIDKDSLRIRLEKSFYNISPNHHALAQRYAFSDNFYADSEVSVDGHHWIVGSYPNAWTESSLMASYGGMKDFRFPTTAPGRLNVAQSNSSLHPEEQLEAGALWHHLERNGISFRNFGEGFELAGVVEDPGEMPTGARFLTNVPMPRPLWDNTSRQYPQYNMNIPDQYRLDAFIREIDDLYVKTGKDLPRLVFIHLPNDHGAKPRPGDGYPFGASYMADNDFALGRMIEYLSKSKWWKSMAVLVTEDDAQGGVDHLDSHRTVFLAASPFARKNYASRANASFPALLKLTFRLLGIPPLNLYDATAADLTDLFTSIPDFTPFTAIRPDPEIFIPEKAKDPIDPQPSPRMDDPNVLREQHRRN